MLKIFLSFVIFLIWSYQVSATWACEDPYFVVPQVCDNKNCLNTSQQQFNTSNIAGIYVLGETSVQDIWNIKNWLDTQLDNILSDFNGRFVLDDFCWDIENNICKSQAMTLESLLAIDKPFKIYTGWWFNFWEANYTYYHDGLHYFLDSYNSILSQIKNSNVGLELTNLVEHVIKYRFDSYAEEHIFTFKNICGNEACTISQTKDISYWDDTSYQVLRGQPTVFNFDALDNLGISSATYSDSEILSWETLDIGFSIYQNLSYFSCISQNYSYTISQSYIWLDGIESEKVELLSDIISIDDAWNIIDTGNKWIIDSELNDDGILKVDIKESFNIFQSWRIILYVDIEDAAWTRVTQQLNISPIDIVPDGPNQSQSEIILRDFDSKQKYYPNDIFHVRAYLSDLNWNNYNTTEAIDIVYWDESISQYIEFVSVDGYNIWRLNDVKSGFDASENKHYFWFSFRFNASGNFKQQFKLIIQDKDASGNIIENSFTELLLDMKDTQGLISQYQIRPVIVSDVIKIRCSQTVILKAICNYDNYSGCDNTLNNTIRADDETFNGQPWSLFSKDVAGNKYEHKYVIDHVDRTAPTLEFIDMDFSSMKASSNQKFQIKLSDSHPNWCRATSNVGYQIEVQKNNGWYIEKVTDTINKIEIQTPTIDIQDLSYVFRQAWNYDIKIVLTDAVGNTNMYTKSFTVVPNDVSSIYSTLSRFDSVGIKYANNEDFYQYNLLLKDIYWNPIYNKKILSLEHRWEEADFQTITTNTINQTGWPALRQDITWATDINGEISFRVRSLAPGQFSESFYITLDTWDNKYQDTNIQQQLYIDLESKNTFLKPFTASLTIDDDSLVLAQSQQAQLNPVTQQCSDCSGITFSNFLDSFDATGEGFVVESKENETGLTTVPQLDFVLNHDWESDFDIDDIGIQTTPYISYSLGGSSVRYYITQTDRVSDIDPITYNGGVFYGLKVVWGLQGQWKQTVTWQEDNFSDITKLDLRKDIQKNAYDLTQGMTSGQILGGVKYVEGDYVMTHNATIDYQTLVVKWDLTIASNITTNIGLIVLDWDITIDNSVTDIQALIYADGGILSDGTGQTQLRIKGSIFTRNTIGWALWTSGNYILPGGSTTTDYDAARSYDLNFLRLGNALWDQNGNSIEDTGEYRDASTLIIADPNNQINPPKGFESE